MQPSSDQGPGWETRYTPCFKISERSGWITTFKSGQTIESGLLLLKAAKLDRMAGQKEPAAAWGLRFTYSQVIEEVDEDAGIGDRHVV
jgi:hypothetical protein